MNKLIATCILGCATAFISNQASAVRLSLEPATQSIAAGAQAQIALTISDLGNLVAPSLGAFLVEVNFDESVLSLDTVTYGQFLGDPADAIETDVVTLGGPGSVSVEEISFLFDTELDALQPDGFALATLTFIGDVPGTSALTFGGIDLSDALGATITGLDLDTANVTVVPLPAAIVFLISALGVALSVRSRAP